MKKHVDDEIDIKVQKRKKFKGKLGLVGKSIGVQITRPIFEHDDIAEEDESYMSDGILSQAEIECLAKRDG